jgi:glycosidase
LQPYPEKNLVFFSNHDVDRPATVVKGDVDKLKMIYTIILTTRGIPCLYYGDEILYESPESGDGFKRQNMFGGWQGDKKNAFTGENLSDKEKDMQNFITKLANYRKESSTFSGKLIHFVPEDGVYVYFRINGKYKTMVVINTSDQDKELDLKRFEECFDGVEAMENVLDDTLYDTVPKTITVGKKSSQVWDLNIQILIEEPQH